MYTKFFGLHEKPFSITPDPRYLFMSERHSEGLAHLVYGVKDSSGFIQLTGEVGTGKTTLVRTLLTRIPKGVDVALILNPQLSAVEFLGAICEELKIPLPQDRSSTRALVAALNKHLLDAHAAGRRTILVIDEAQNLATEVLEEVRLLTNLETAKQKLLQIILIAQPELREKLSQTNLRQLAQRVTGRYHLEPLSRDETIRYIDHRLKVAGGLAEILDDRAKKEVYRISGGVPRLINVICDRALLGAYSRDTRRVTQDMVRKAATEVSGESSSVANRRGLITALAILTGIVILGGLWALLRIPAPLPETEVPVPVASIASVPVADKPATAATDDDVDVGVPHTEVLDRALRSPGADTSLATAMRTLLSLWQIDFDGSGNACTQAEAAGLSCLSQRGAWSVLRKLDRPVVLTLTDSEGETRHAVLTAVDGEIADIRLGDTRVQAGVDELGEYWYGEFVLLWRPPNGDPSVLARGAQGPKVRWLRQSLAALDPDGRLRPGDSDLFDDDLERQLLEFQRRNRLDTDGLAGQQTQIIINSQLGLDGRPRLSGT